MCESVYVRGYVFMFTKTFTDYKRLEKLSTLSMNSAEMYNLPLLKEFKMSTQNNV